MGASGQKGCVELKIRSRGFPNKGVSLRTLNKTF